MTDTHTAAHVIASFLVAESHAVFPGSVGDWTVYIDWLPDDAPDDSICISNVSGTPDAFLMRGGIQVDHPGLQVLVRSKDSAVAVDKIIQLDYVMQKLYRDEAYVDDSAYHLQSFQRTSTIVPMERDAVRQRNSFVFNGQLSFRQL